MQITHEIRGMCKRKIPGIVGYNYGCHTLSGS